MLLPPKGCASIFVLHQRDISPNKDTKFLGTGTNSEINKLTKAPVA